VTRVGHDPLADYARLNVAAHYRRLADAATVAAAALGGDTAAELAGHAQAVEDAHDKVLLALRSLEATRAGRARGSRAAG
jgi:hypothetical protein